MVHIFKPSHKFGLTTDWRGWFNFWANRPLVLVLTNSIYLRCHKLNLNSTHTWAFVLVIISLGTRPPWCSLWCQTALSSGQLLPHKSPSSTFCTLRKTLLQTFGKAPWFSQLPTKLPPKSRTIFTLSESKRNQTLTKRILQALSRHSQTLEARAENLYFRIQWLHGLRQGAPFPKSLFPYVILCSLPRASLLLQPTLTAADFLNYPPSSAWSRTSSLERILLIFC